MSLEILLGFKNKRDFHTGCQIGVFNDIEKSSGFQLAYQNLALVFYGFQAGLINRVCDYIEGLQLGAYNEAEISAQALQLGGFNAVDVIKGSQAGLVNISVEQEGSQLGLANISDETSGFQAGIANISFTKLKGVQFGLFCYADEGNYLQIGLLTMRKSREEDKDKSKNQIPWYKKMTPFVGWRHGREKVKIN